MTELEARPWHSRRHDGRTRAPRRDDRSRPVWQLLAVLYLLSNVLAAGVAWVGRGAAPGGQRATTIAWLLLLAAPVVIFGTHPVVATVPAL